MDQLDFASARWGDPETSHDAARSVSALTEKRAAVLRTIRDFQKRSDIWHPEAVGATDVDVAAWYIGPSQSPSGLRTRRAELVDLGLVWDSGQRVRLPSGRMAIVWQA